MGYPHVLQGYSDLWVYSRQPLSPLREPNPLLIQVFVWACARPGWGKEEILHFWPWNVFRSEFTGLFVLTFWQQKFIMTNFHKYLLPVNILKVIQDLSPPQVFSWTLATAHQTILSKPQKQKVHTHTHSWMKRHRKMELRGTNQRDRWGNGAWKATSGRVFSRSWECQLARTCVPPVPTQGLRWNSEQPVRQSPNDPFNGAII